MEYENIGFKNAQNSIFLKELVHGFGEKFEILLTFRFIQNTPKKVFGDVLARKQAFLDNKKLHLKKSEIGIFSKGIAMNLVKKLKFFHLFCLSKIDREKVFADVLDKKEDFKDHKNICLRKTQNSNFSKGVRPWFSSKMGDFFNSDFYAK